MEYRGRGADLRPAFDQLQRYTPSLDSPPLLAACDVDKIAIRTAWTNAVSQIHEVPLDAMRDPRELRKLKWTRNASAPARRAKPSRPKPRPISWTSPDGSAPAGLIARMLATSHHFPDRFPKLAGQLFVAMRTGGEVRMEAIEWFNGNLFDSNAALPLTAQDITAPQKAAERDWADIEPCIHRPLRAQWDTSRTAPQPNGGGATPSWGIRRSWTTR